MKVEESFVRRLTISEVPGLDPIRVMLEDIGQNQGRINIECYGQSWACYWGSMGGTIAEFVTRCDEHYLAGKLSSIPARVFDPDGLKEMLKREVISDRRKFITYKREARERFNRIDDLDIPGTVDGCWSISGTMEELLGEEWWYRLPEKTNPDYEYLTRIIKTVQMALMLEVPAGAISATTWPPVTASSGGSMPFPLRLLPDGARFVLCRTGQKFRLLRRERVNGKLRYFVERSDGGFDWCPPHLSWLHHSCHVKLLVRAS